MGTITWTQTSLEGIIIIGAVVSRSSRSLPKNLLLMKQKSLEWVIGCKEKKSFKFVLFFSCRFEKLDITPKSAQKIKPVLEHWMKEAEER